MEKYAFGLEYIDGDVIEKVSYDSTVNYFDFNILLSFLNLHIIDLLKVIPNEKWIADEHFHTYFELHIIPKGKGYINIEDHDFNVNGKQLYITGPYVKHSQVADSKNPMAEYCLKFQINISENTQLKNFSSKKEVALLKEILSRTYPFAFEDIFETRSKFDKVFIEVKERNLGYQLRIQTLITDIIIDVLRTVSSTIGSIPKYAVLQKPIHQERIERIEHFIKTNFMNPITLKDLSSFLFLSPRQINRIMEKELHMTFHEYLLNQRFQFAKKLLEEACLTVEEVSYKSGFSSPVHLYQVFKRFGYPTPSKMRKFGNDI